MRIVLDTSVLVAAIRSPQGASKALLNLALSGQIDLLVSNPLLLEYEAVLTRPEHLEVAGFSPQDIEVLLDAICDSASPVRIYWRLRPQLTDANDEMVLETAINAQAQAIVTFNRAHFIRAAERFGIAVLSPSEVLKRVRRS